MNPSISMNPKHSKIYDFDNSLDGINPFLPDIEESNDGITLTVFNIMFISIYACLLLCVAYIGLRTTLSDSRRHRILRDIENQQNQQNQRKVQTIAERLAAMTTDAKLSYYNKLFDKQGNQIELTNDQIIVVTSRDSQENGRHNMIDTVGKDDIETGNRGDVVPEQQCDDVDDDDAPIIDAEEDFRLVYLSADTIRSCGEPSKCDGRKENSAKNDNAMTSKIYGECVICLEYFQAGDMLVYNSRCNNNNDDDNDNDDAGDNAGDNSQPTVPIEAIALGGCNHVYHKICMVLYLANRMISQNGLQNGEGDTPSCPTCRQPYCELLPILLVLVNDSE